MKVIRPYAPTLTYTSVAANAELEWAAGTTYGLDDLVKVTDQAIHKVYRSTRGNNTNRYPPNWTDPQQESATSATSTSVLVGAKTFTTQSGKGFSAGMAVQIAKTTTPRTVSMAAEVTGYTGTSLTVSVYSVTGEGTHSGWTITTEDEIGFWEEVGATEQYKMLDEYINTKTIDTEEIHIKLSVERVDHVALFGLLGKTVELALWDEDETAIAWSTTINLAYGSPTVVQISDWFEYFFGEYSVREDISESIGAILFAGVLEIKVIADTGADAAIGNIVVGRTLEIGTAQYGLSAGILDFSRRETDEQGRTTLEPGYWAKRSEIPLVLRHIQVDPVYKALSGLRGVPTAWIGVPGVDGYEAFNLFGTFAEFDVTVSSQTTSYCNLTLEGLI